MFFLPSRNQEVFIGHNIKNSDLYLLDVEQMNGTDSHSIELQASAMLAVRFETVKGSMHMEISAPDGSPLYQGNGKGVTEFTVNISESGTCAKTKVSPVDIPTGWDPRTKQQRRVALTDFSAAPWQGFEKSERGPNSSSLFQPLAAVVAVALGCAIRIPLGPKASV